MRDEIGDALPWPDPFPHLAEALATPTGMPSRIGRYEIRGVLGEGGMGVVYRGAQEHPTREVALKVLRASLATPALVQRFRREVEALGRLENEGIARLYEVGEASPFGFSVPFFAMELVDGVPITRFARDRNLALKERVKLLVLVCNAVEYAHSRGVVHRDLKPGNILVTEAGQPKVLDFGIARVTESGGGPTTFETSPGTVMGTIAYMSPEQLKSHPEEVDPRSDVYALGVIAYELLTEKLPLDVRHRSLADAARIIEDTTPLLPSTLDRSLAGDLDAILVTALEKDPNHRYASAGALAADLLRHVRDEPVLARRPTPLIALAKWMRRNRGVVASLSAILLILAAAAVLTVSFVIKTQASEQRAVAAGRRAAKELMRAEVVKSFLIELIGSADPFYDSTLTGRDVTLGSALEVAESQVGFDFQESPEDEAAIREVIAGGFRAVGRHQEALEQLSMALDRNSAGREQGVAANRHLSIATEIAVTKGMLGDFGGISAVQSALDLHRERFGRHRSQINALTKLAWLLSRVQRYEEALEASKLAVSLAEELCHPTDILYLRAKTNLGSSLSMAGRLDEARDAHEDALGRFQERYPSGHPVIASLRLNLARLDEKDGELRSATRGYREAITSLRQRAPKTPELAMAHQNLGRVLLRQQDFEGAESSLTDALAVFRASGAEQLPESFETLRMVAYVWFRRGQIREAEEALRDYVAYFRKSGAKASWTSLEAEAMLAACVWMLGDPESAEQDLVRCYRAAIEVGGEAHPRAPFLANLLVKFYDQTGRSEEADPFRALAKRN